MKQSLLIFLFVAIATFSGSAQTSYSVDLVKKARLGDAQAMADLAWCYAIGDGIPQDYSQAELWLSNANKRGWSGTNAWLQRLDKREKDLLALAKKGDATAQNELGDIYLYFYGGNENQTKAVKWYKKSADSKDKKGLFKLGKCYYHGRGVKTDYKKAFSLFFRSASRGYDEAQYHVGICHALGIGVPQDKNMAEVFFKEAASQGNPKLQCEIAKEYHYGKIVPRDYEKAFHWFQESANGDNDEAQYWLGYYFYTGICVEQDDSQALKWFSRVADGDGDASLLMGYIYYKQGELQNYDKAFEAFMRADAFAFNAKESEYFLGLCYLYGHGVNQNYQKAFDLFTSSSEKGNTMALGKLGEMYFQGKHVVENPSKAFELLYQASTCDNPSADAMNMLSSCYRYGLGTKKDLSKADSWLTKAQETGSDEANMIRKIMERK